MNQKTSDASTEGKYTFTLVFVVFIVMTGGFVFLATLYAEVIASWVSGTDAIESAEYTKFDELWEPLSKWYSSVVGVFVGFAGAIVALWLAVQVHKLSEKQHKLTEKQHELTEKQYQTDQQLLKVEQFKFAKDRSKKNAKVGRSMHTAAKPSAPMIKLFDLSKKAYPLAVEKSRYKEMIEDKELEDSDEGYQRIIEKIHLLGEEGFPAVKDLLDILEEKLLFSDIDTSLRALKPNFEENFLSEIKKTLVDDINLKYELEISESRSTIIAESALKSIESYQKDPGKKGLYPEAVISSLRFLIDNLEATNPSVSFRLEQIQMLSIGNLWGHLFISKIARPGDAFKFFDSEYVFLPVAKFCDLDRVEVWDFVPSMINALFDFPTPFQVVDKEVEKIIGGLQEDITNSEEKQSLQELLRENLHHEILQLTTKDDYGFFTWLMASSNDEWRNPQASTQNIYPTKTRHEYNPEPIDMPDCDPSDSYLTPYLVEHEKLLEALDQKSPLYWGEILESYHINNYEIRSHNRGKEFDILEKTRSYIWKYLEIDYFTELDKKHGTTRLHRVAVYDTAENLQLLLDNDADVNTQDNYGLSPLHWAATKGTPEHLQLLLDNDAKVNARTKKGQTPLHSAACFCSEIIQVLLDKGADVNARDADGKTPLHTAASGGKPTIQVLLDASADVNARDANGETPLHSAALKGLSPENVQVLLDAGADAKAKNKKGKTPWDLAQENKTIKGTDGYWALNEALYE